MEIKSIIENQWNQNLVNVDKQPKENWKKDSITLEINSGILQCITLKFWRVIMTYLENCISIKWKLKRNEKYLEICDSPKLIRVYKQHTLIFTELLFSNIN